MKPTNRQLGMVVEAICNPPDCPDGLHLRGIARAVWDVIAPIVHAQALDEAAKITDAVESCTGECAHRIRVARGTGPVRGK